MTWTHNTPMTPGWYWHRELTPINGQRFVRICEVEEVRGILYVRGLSPGRFIVVNASGHWQGPLEPEEG